MKTFYVDNILCDYSCGILIVSAENKEEAIKILLDKDNQGYKEGKPGYILGKYDEDDVKKIINDMQELKPNQIIAVHGGG